MGLLESSCLKAGTGITDLVSILMVSDQWTYTCLHHNTPFYAFINHILTQGRFPDFSWFGGGISVDLYGRIISDEIYQLFSLNCHF